MCSQGTFVYKRKNRGHYYKEFISFDAKHRFRTKTLGFGISEDLSGIYTQTPVTHVYDGQDDYIIIEDEKSPFVEIKSYKPIDIGEEFLIVGGLYPGASFLHGRGLSKLQNIQIRERLPTTVTITARAFENSTIIAQLDANRGYVAKQIDRVKQGVITQRITLSAFKNIQVGNNSCWIASSILCQSRGTNKNMQEIDRYELISANLENPESSVFEVTLKPGWRVSDARTGKPIGWIIKTVRSSRDLRALSEVKTLQLSQAQAKEHRFQQLQNYINILLLFLPFLFFGAIYQWRRQKDKSKANS